MRLILNYWIIPIAIRIHCCIVGLFNCWQTLSQYAIRNTQYQIIALFLAISSSAFGQQVNIIEKPIIFDATRTRLSIDYLKRRHDLVQKTATISPIMVVLHWTASRTLMGTYNAFNKSILPRDRCFFTLFS